MQHPRFLFAILFFVIIGTSFISLSCGDDDDDFCENPPEESDDDDDDDDDDDNDDNDDNNDDNNDDDTFPNPPTFTSGVSDRVAEYIQYCADHALEGSPTQVWGQVCRLELGMSPLNQGAFDATIAKINSLVDTADFQMASMVRILYQYYDSPLISSQLMTDIEDMVLNFKYWIDEPFPDAGMCFWSENHQILFSSAEYLLGYKYSDSLFPPSNMTGQDHYEKAKLRVLQWLDNRALLGFSEWHSNVYYNEDIPAVANLADFAPDADVKEKAKMVLDIMAFDLASNTYKGMYATTHGRTYPSRKFRGDGDSTDAITWIWFGQGQYTGDHNYSGVSIGTSREYTLPYVLEDIGGTDHDEFESKERMSMDVDDNNILGLDYQSYEDVMIYWGMGAYPVWQVLETTINMAEDYNLWGGGFFDMFEFAKHFLGTGLLPIFGKIADPITRGSAMEEVNTYVYRTTDYQMGSAQDYNPGTWASQHHIWHAILDKDTPIFSTFPGGLSDDYTASDWNGGWTPRVAQEKNALIAIYRLPDNLIVQALSLFDVLMKDYTHAYFPKNNFDEFQQSGKWFFGRKGDGYAALYSAVAPTFATTGDHIDAELIAPGKKNVYICQLGNVDEFGSFAAFVQAVSTASVTVQGSHVIYDSPSVGEMEFSWEGSFYLEGERKSLAEYKRFDNPYCKSEFLDKVYYVEKDGLYLYLDFDGPTRILGQQNQ